MLRTRSWLICMMLVAMLLAACADDDDNDAEDAATSTPAAVETTAPADSEDAGETATEATGEPTEEAETTPAAETTEEATEEAGETATEDVAGTATEDTGSAMSTPDADATEADPGATPGADETPSSIAADPEIEAVLFETVIASEDLSEEWTELSTSASADIPTGDTQTDIGFCNAEPYENLTERLASVETEFEQDPVEGPFLFQSLAAYPEELAIEAFEHAREITTNCTEWTDDDDITYTLETQEDYPEFGDESFVVRITFEAPGIGAVPGDFVFIRVGGLVSYMGYIGLGELDTAALTDIAEIAADKMENAELDS